MKPRFAIFILGIVVLIIIIIGIVASSGGTTRKTTLGLVVCTVQAEIGVETVKIINMNTGASIIKTGTQLTFKSFSFNCTKGDTLQFHVTTMKDYIFNAWTFNTGTFDQHNPLTITISADTVMKAEMLIQIPETTPTPTLNVTG